MPISNSVNCAERGYFADNGNNDLTILRQCLFSFYHRLMSGTRLNARPKLSPRAGSR